VSDADGGGGDGEEPLSPLRCDFEERGLARYAEVPARLSRLYGGGFGFTPPVLFANFVASADGVVALGPGIPSAGSVISGRDPADRFVMALLRACADAVVIGAGTLRATPGHVWTPEHVCGWAAAELRALRSSLGRAPRPRLVVLTRTGDLPPDHPGLAGDVLVATTPAGAVRARLRLPAAEVVTTPAADGVDLVHLFARLRARGWGTILTEGGPVLVGELLRARLLDQLFLTVAPVLAGRQDGRHRPGVVDGVELLPRDRSPLALLSVRRHASHLFLRYACAERAEPDRSRERATRSR